MPFPILIGTTLTTVLHHRADCDKRKGSFTPDALRCVNEPASADAERISTCTFHSDEAVINFSGVVAVIITSNVDSDSYGPDCVSVTPCCRYLPGQVLPPLPATSTRWIESGSLISAAKTISLNAWRESAADEHGSIDVV